MWRVIQVRKNCHATTGVYCMHCCQNLMVCKKKKIFYIESQVIRSFVRSGVSISRRVGGLIPRLKGKWWWQNITPFEQFIRDDEDQENDSTHTVIGRLNTRVDLLSKDLRNMATDWMFRSFLTNRHNNIMTVFCQNVVSIHKSYYNLWGNSCWCINIHPTSHLSITLVCSLFKFNL